MQVEIITRERSFNLHGFSGTALNKDYSGTAFRLMDKMWKAVKGNDLPNKGMNTWVYEPQEKVFAGVELLEPPGADTGLESKAIVLYSYAYYKHIGPYYLIKESGQKMRDELQARGFTTTLPYIEIYGHWTPDESKLETELLMSLL